MKRKVIAGGIVCKDNKYLLVKETKEICKDKWNIPAGSVEESEDVFEAARREIFEETGCVVEITGLLKIIDKHTEALDLVEFFFDTEIISDDINFDGIEISDVKWFTYEELLSMKNELRNDGYFLSIIDNKRNNKVYPLDLIELDKNDDKIIKKI